MKKLLILAVTIVAAMMLVIAASSMADLSGRSAQAQVPEPKVNVCLDVKRINGLADGQWTKVQIRNLVDGADAIWAPANININWNNVRTAAVDPVADGPGKATEGDILDTDFDVGNVEFNALGTLNPNTTGKSACVRVFLIRHFVNLDGNQAIDEDGSATFGEVNQIGNPVGNYVVLAIKAKADAQVLAHELGHILGLVHTDEDDNKGNVDIPENLMGGGDGTDLNDDQITTARTGALKRGVAKDQEPSNARHSITLPPPIGKLECELSGPTTIGRGPVYSKPNPAQPPPTLDTVDTEIVLMNLTGFCRNAARTLAIPVTMTVRSKALSPFQSSTGKIQEQQNIVANALDCTAANPGFCDSFFDVFVNIVAKVSNDPDLVLTFHNEVGVRMSCKISAIPPIGCDYEAKNLPISVFGEEPSGETAEAVALNQTVIEVTDSSAFNVEDEISIDGEQMRVTGVGEDPDTLTVVRAQKETDVAPHAQGADIFVKAGQFTEFATHTLKEPPVGGISVGPGVAGLPLKAPDSSGSSAGLLAGVASAAAGAFALGGAAWFARRRWMR